MSQVCVYILAQLCPGREPRALTSSSFLRNMTKEAQGMQVDVSHEHACSQMPELYWRACFHATHGVTEASLHALRLACKNWIVSASQIIKPGWRCIFMHVCMSLSCMYLVVCVLLLFRSMLTGRLSAWMWWWQLWPLGWALIDQVSACMHAQVYPLYVTRITC